MRQVGLTNCYRYETHAPRKYAPQIEACRKWKQTASKSGVTGRTLVCHLLPRLRTQAVKWHIHTHNTAVAIGNTRVLGQLEHKNLHTWKELSQKTSTRRKAADPEWASELRALSKRGVCGKTSTSFHSVGPDARESTAPR